MQCRDSIIADLRKWLIGPGLGTPGADGTHHTEVIEGRLSLAYMAGMLFAQEEKVDRALAADEGDAADEDPDDPLSMATAMLPSSMGLSVCISPSSSVSVSVFGARYEPNKIVGGKGIIGEKETRVESENSEDEEKQDEANVKKRRRKTREAESWRRVPLRVDTKKVDGNGLQKCSVLEERATLDVLVRRLPDGNCLLTISVINNAKGGRRSPEDTLYQVSIRVESHDGEILPYPVAAFVPPTDDERELRVIYGQQRPYAAGHGISADWQLSDGKCKAAWSEAIPIAHVWRPNFDNLTIVENGTKTTFQDPDLFSVSALAEGKIPIQKLAPRLNALVDFYERWIGYQSTLPVEAGLEPDAKRMLDRCGDSARRMRQGIDILLKDKVIAKCFVLANRAMLMSIAHGLRASGRSRRDGLQGPFDLGKAETTVIDYFANEAKWRPFQLAFFLQVLPSLVDGECSDRELVDVIWFATGGGKTEAYLLISAFELLRRRAVLKDRGGGSAVMNRYTYRFLTADQFQRTAGVICSLEMLRRELLELGEKWVGDDEFSIGLFVGGEVSPNSLADANERLSELLEASEPRSKNPFPIESCPCCGTLLVPNQSRKLQDGSPDRAFYGFASAANAFRVNCPDENCAFHQHLPVYFVDEQLYKNPPSFLLGTIDKFAMVPWQEKAGKLFGVGTNKEPPSIIIQDELHLISGPLGTLAGIYEAGFETLVRSIGKFPPKVIASTATIRNAALQCKRIYGRRAAVFPSPGLRADDSFFSKLDVGNMATSRAYCGVMAQGMTATVAASWTISALLQEVFELQHKKSASADEIDAYWTLVAYHNSKRELGRIANATRDEIPTRIKVYAASFGVERPSHFKILELKAHSETPVPQARQMLARRHSVQDPAIDVVPCTNIISVGVDIDRLGLMLVNGQPKLSAEYIQATSRVGRGKIPGLVVTAYSPSKPRDRSHYEAFRDYHERFYSFVEPTSVTPGALPAIDRALHAALVTVIRHGTSLRANESAKSFDVTRADVSNLIDLLKARLQAAYDDKKELEERTRLAAKLDERIEEWTSWASSCDLRYALATKAANPRLLVKFGDKKSDNVGWYTLQSMRHVDKEIILEDGIGV